MPNLKLNVLWRMASGLPYSSSYGFIVSEYENEFLFSETDKRYFPSYQRLDVRLNYEHQNGDKIFTIYLDVTNLYNHKNVYDQTWETTITSDDLLNATKTICMRTFYMLPLVPLFGISYSF